MRHRRPPRLPNDGYVGAHRVFFTMCAFKRKLHFADLATGERSRTQLLETAAGWDVEVIAYCFIPDHLHLLVEGKSERPDARKFAHVFRQTSGFHFRAGCGPVSGKRAITITF